MQRPKNGCQGFAENLVKAMDFVEKGDLIDSSYCTDDKLRETLENDVEGLVPDGARRILKNISQWGLKEVWLGSPARSHSRWDHTKGALTIALLWCRHLMSQDLAKHGLRQLGLKDAEDALRKLVLLAVALHDIGHLPFAHLLGEVLESINWVPEGKGLSGLEQEVLRARLENDFKDLWSELGSKLSWRPDHLKLAVTDLISGRHGLPWAQAIVNSPIDADKLDYVQRDSQFLRLTTHLAGARLPPTDEQKAKWLAEFFASQTVNHAGLLCLSGRSAVFAADLMRDRIYLYDRFYLSPEVRTAERMAFEIVQQFLIRAVMSEDFRMRTIEKIGGGSDREISGLGSRMEVASGGDVRKSKCQLAVRILKLLARKAEGEFMEFEPLKIMYELLSGEESIDAGVRKLWEECFSRLVKLKDRKVTLDRLAKEVLVREPLVLRRRQYDLALEILRPLQHVYARDVLIDLVKLPRALGAGHRWRRGPGRRADEVDWSILVPEGPISRWGAGSKGCQPLTDEAVRELERPYARVLVVAPFGSDSHSEYIWDRVRAALLEGGVELIKKARGT
jgi:hypothetical protein